MITEREMEQFKVMKLIYVIGIVVVLVFAFYCLCLNHVGINEVGIAYNSVGGKVWVQSRPGWYFTYPTVEVANITTLPMKIEIPSNAKVINTKIVRFNPAGVDEFIRLQGFSYFSDQSLENVLMGYAFSGEKYSFLDVIQQSGTENFNAAPLSNK